jgi:hypothetical protein
MGQYNKLNQKVQRGKLDVLWDLDECAGRLEDVSRIIACLGGSGHGTL